MASGVEMTSIAPTATAGGGAGTAAKAGDDGRTGASSAAGAGDTRPFREIYAERLRRDVSLMPAGSYPAVEVAYDNLSYTLHLPKAAASRQLNNVGTAFANVFLGPMKAVAGMASSIIGGAGTMPASESGSRLRTPHPRSPATPAAPALRFAATTTLHVLSGCTGVLKPGSVTLLLSPPGGGKTAFLKTLGQRFAAQHVTGTVTYSGLSPAEAASHGIYLKQLVQYVDQLDQHLPQLTVRETLEFAHSNGTVEPSIAGVPELVASAARKVDDVVQLLSLQTCVNTVVGDEMLRGVSGGEKKRVTIGESMVTNARVWLMDEISTGLDSAVTFDIVSGIRAWAKATRGTVVIALLQPTPEVFGLFDDVILLREGCVVYHGPRADMSGYLSWLGFVPPGTAAAAPAPVPAPAAVAAGTPAAVPIDRAVSNPTGAEAIKVDVADYVVDLLANPAAIYARGVTEAAAARGPGAAAPRPALSGAGPVSLSTADVTIAVKPTLPLALPSSGGATPLGSPQPLVGAAFAHSGRDAIVSDPTAWIAAGRAPATTAEFVHAWSLYPQRAAWHTPTLSAAAKVGSEATSDATPPLALTTPFAQAQYGRPYPRSAWTHFGALLLRQFRLTYRNRVFITFRVLSSTILALVLGSTFYQLPIDKSIDKFGMLLFASINITTGNFSEIGAAAAAKYIVYKHLAAGTHPSQAYIAAVTLLHVPIAIIETTVFSIILYWMAGLAADAGRFFFFLLTMTLLNCAVASLYRACAYGFTELHTAMAASGPIMNLQMLYSGYLVTRSKMSWLLFAHYISLFGYGLRSMALNEFEAPQYARNDAGLAIMRTFDFQTESQWKWGGIGFIAFFYIAATLLTGVVLARVRIERNIGTARTLTTVDVTGGGAAAGADVSSEDDGSGSAEGPASSPGVDSIAPTPRDFADEAAGGATPAIFTPVAVAPAAAAAATEPAASKPAAPRIASSFAPGSIAASAAAAASASNALPFEAMTVGFSDIHYDVRLPNGTMKTLLQGVTGFAKPGTLTALMGASGAGKTTLLDVIAGRKNTGVMAGTITLNGHPKEQRSFARLTAYVEQNDIHEPFATVRESLQFSARLRLPSSVSAASRAAFVAEVLTLLELDDIADRKVGEVGAADGLSPGERKRLTIGVELCSNCPILFLDEPTTGLDSRAAAVVVRVMKRIAQRGRTVITTIHQPSAELFLMMDSLLLLQRGGWQVYFGPLGARARDLVRYIESIPGTPRCPRRMNPASWMLDVLAGSDSSGDMGEASTAIVRAASSVARGTSGAARGGAGAGALEAPPAIARSAPALAPTTTVTPLSVLEGAIDETRAPPSDKSPGPIDYQRILQSTEMWRTVLAEAAKINTPAPGSRPYRFDSVYAHGLLTQTAVLLSRNSRSYWRNVEYNFVRIMTLVGLMVLFGTIYYKLIADSESGVQSMTSVIFMTTSFIGLLNMNVAMPVYIKYRPVFYRERASYLYDSTAHGLASILIEMPWLALLVMCVVPIIYFMVGFNPDAAAFWFYAFVAWVFCLVFISLAQVVAAVMPSVNVAQAVVGLVIPILFLFGGLFLRVNSIPVWWRWLHYADPIKYALSALLAPQFYCNGSGCPSIEVFDFATFATRPVNRYRYVADSFGVDYATRWTDVGYLCIFIAGFQIVHFIALRYISYLKR